MSGNTIRILIVDDEEDILELLQYNLRLEGYEIAIAHDGQEGIDQFHSFKPDLILLDIMMPKMDGIEVCKYLKRENLLEDTMVVFLTARSESFTQIAALDAGGDDFIIKPVKPNVLKSRIKAILRRRIISSDSYVKEESFGDLKIHYDEYKVTLNEAVIELPKKEFELLKLLCSKPGKVFERNLILQSVWGSSVIVGDRTIDVHIRKLREKIGSDYITTVKGVGYKFEA